MAKAKKVSEREIPYDQEAEQAVAGAVLLDPECICKIELSPDDFFFHEYRVIFKVCIDMWQRGERISEPSVGRNLPSDVPAIVLPKAIASAPASVHVEFYADRVREYSLRRRLYGISNDISDLSLDRKLTVNEIFDKTHAMLEDLSWPPLMSRFVIFRNGVINA